MNMVSQILPNGDEMPSGESLPALQTEITAIVESRNAAIATMQDALDNLSAAYAASNSQTGAAQEYANRAHMGTVWIRPDFASTPMCSFMPKYH